MTKESIPNFLQNRIAEASAGTTVFSDGSTFDYENGYKSNGAPIATRDRTTNPSIVKSHKIFTSDLVFAIAVWTLLFTAAAISLIGVVSNVQKRENVNFVKAEMQATGHAHMVQHDKGTLIFHDTEGSVVRCDLEMVSNHGDPVGHIFCGQGTSAVLSVPLPHDPSNVFYTADKSIKNPKLNHF